MVLRRCSVSLADFIVARSHSPAVSHHVFGLEDYELRNHYDHFRYIPQLRLLMRSGHSLVAANHLRRLMAGSV